MPGMSRSELEEILVLTLKNMMNNGMMPKVQCDLKQVARDVASAMEKANLVLGKEQFLKQLGDKNFFKTLKLAFSMSLVNSKELDKSKHLNLSLLFTDPLNKKNIDEKQLALELNKLLMKLYKLQPSPSGPKNEDEKNLDQLVNIMTKSIMKELQSNDPKLQNRTMDAVLTDALSEVIRMEYGGIDTRHPGSIAAVVQVVANDPNWVDNEPHIFKNAAIEHRRPEVNLDKAAPQEEPTKTAPSPFHTTPKPPGTTTSG